MRHGATCLLFAAFIAVAAHAADEPAAIGGLRLTLAADPAEARAGDAVKLTLTFENVSKEPLRVFWPIPIIVTDNVQLAVTGPAVQRGLIARPMVHMIPGPENFPELAPGAKRMFAFQLEGNPPGFPAWAIRLGAPGVYRVQASYRLRGAYVDLMLQEGGPDGRGLGFKPWTGTVESNAVEIKLGGEFKPAPGPGISPDEPGPLLPMPDLDGGDVPVPALPRPILPDRPRRIPAPTPGAERGP